MKIIESWDEPRKIILKNQTIIMDHDTCRSMMENPDAFFKKVLKSYDGTYLELVAELDEELKNMVMP